ncbi:MFS transporter [Anaerolineales bacterium HSG6]|nr:MFS transporter [Anaerolineales bacterium HSG6]MDM8530622.1 MFS transporter [Anaerolineales bacterium HSG25]
MERHGTKITYTLLIIQSLFSAAMIMGFTIGSIIAVDLANNLRWTGIPAMVTMIGAAMIAYPIGRLMDSIGRRRGLSLGYIVGIIGMFVAGIAVIYQSLTLFLVGMFGLGIARGVVGLGRYAAADANPPHRRGWGISMVVLGGTVGSVAGPSLISGASAVAANIGLPEMSGPWFLGSFCFVIALILATLFLRPDPQLIARHYADPAPTLNKANEAGRSFVELMRLPRARLAVSAMIFGQMSMALVMVVTPVHMNGHNHELSSISFVIMAHTLGMFGLSFLTGRLIDRFGESVMIIWGCFILAVACVTAPLFDNVYWLATALFLLGLGWNFCFVAGSTMLANILEPHEKGRIQGVADSWLNLASGMSSFGSGFLFASVGFWVMSWATILITLPPVLQLLASRYETNGRLAKVQIGE